MPKKKLTDLFVEAVKAPASGRIEYFDTSFGGLALRVTDQGHKSWSLFYRMQKGGKLRRLTLGTYPAIKPAQARREASNALERVRQGFDPSAEKQQQRSADSSADAFSALVADYLKLYAEKNTAPGTYKETKRVLQHKDLARWRDRPIAEIAKRDVISVIDDIAKRAEVQANRTLSRLKALFNWAVSKDRLAASPAEGVEPPTKEHSRDRILGDDELRWLWAACTKSGWPFGPLVKLLILTAQRRDEVAGMEWLEVELKKRTWVIPRGRAKNNREHLVQLSEAAAAILEEQTPSQAYLIPRVEGQSLLFTTTGETCVSGFSRAKERLDQEMVKERRRSLGLPEDDDGYRKAMHIPAGKPMPVELPDWTLHDLRRTATTGMAMLNIPPHVVDKILNHASGTIRGVAAVYNRFEYLEERQRALEAWGRYVTELISPRADNIRKLPARKAHARVR